MANFWDKWTVHEGLDPDAELRSLQQRFRAIRKRYDRTVRRRKTLPKLRDVLTASGVAILLVLPFVLSPFSVINTLKHLVASPNCDAARSVGLAPALQGQPGYWRSHDRDQDGIACEPWPRAD